MSTTLEVNRIMLPDNVAAPPVPDPAHYNFYFRNGVPIRQNPAGVESPLTGALTGLGAVRLASPGTFNISPLTSIFNSIRVLLKVRAQVASNFDNLLAQANLSTTATDYRAEFLYASGATPQSLENTGGTATMASMFFNGATSPANHVSVIALDFIDFANTTDFKTVLYKAFIPLDATTGTIWTGTGGGQFRSTSPITSIQIKAAGGNFLAGSTMEVYGLTA